MMDVGEISPRARALKATAARLIEELIWPIERDAAETGALDPAKMERARQAGRDAGLAMLNMPPSVGGADLPMLDLVALEEETGKATNGLGFLIVDRGPRELLDAATPDQIERYVLPVVRGETREAWAITEPGAGSDVAGIAATAKRDGDDWIVNGEKWFVTGGDQAGYFIVLANAERDGDGGSTPTLFLIDNDTPGLIVTRAPHFMHDPYHAKHLEMKFVDCRVPEANRVGGSGGDDAKRWFALERLMIAARCCGAAERLLDLARDWALEREAFGHPIADYQGIQFMLADSLTELAAARLLTYHAATAWDRNVDRKIVHGKVAMAKLYASEMANRVADRTVQIFGGRGYMTEHPAERYYRELRVDRIWEGTSEIQRSIIARGLLKRGAAAYLDGAPDSLTDR